MQLKDITPAEAILLSHDNSALNDAKLPSHRVNCGRMPLERLTVTGTAKSMVEVENGIFELRKGKLLKKEVVDTETGEVTTPAVYETIERTDVEELQRLQRKFNEKMVNLAFPGVSPELPQTFDKVPDWSEEDRKIVTASLPKVEETKKV